MFDVFIDGGFWQVFWTQAQAENFADRYRKSHPAAHQNEVAQEVEVKARKRFCVSHSNGQNVAYVGSCETFEEAESLAAECHARFLQANAAQGIERTESVKEMWIIADEGVSYEMVAPPPPPPAPAPVVVPEPEPVLNQLQSPQPPAYSLTKAIWDATPKANSTATTDVRFREEHFEFDTQADAEKFADAYSASRRLSRNLLDVIPRQRFQVSHGGYFVTSFATQEEADQYVGSRYVVDALTDPEAVGDPSKGIRTPWVIRDMEKKPDVPAATEPPVEVHPEVQDTAATEIPPPLETGTLVIDEPPLPVDEPSTPEEEIPVVDAETEKAPDEQTSST